MLDRCERYKQYAFGKRGGEVRAAQKQQEHLLKVIDTVSKYLTPLKRAVVVKCVWSLASQANY